MSKHKIAQDWHTVTTLFNQKTQVFTEIRKNVGHYTAATAVSKIGDQALAAGYHWKEKPFSGMGGYWVDSVGNTIELCPRKIASS